MRNTGTILDKILASKRLEVAQRRRKTSLEDLARLVREQPFPLNLAGSLWGEKVRLIAEIKKASPSKGLLTKDYDPPAIAAEYVQNGAAAISVITEVEHFQGSIEHLRAVKTSLGPDSIPVLKKDFHYDPYQIYEARANGADAALLIVAVLGKSQLEEMLAAANGIWLQTLVEVHDQNELEMALSAGAEIIGINHRDLKTFELDMTLAKKLVPMIPKGRMIVAESGIITADDITPLRRAGVHAVLVGEALITASDRSAKVRELAGAR